MTRRESKDFAPGLSTCFGLNSNPPNSQKRRAIFVLAPLVSCL
jgi:hypothetical protein